MKPFACIAALVVAAPAASAQDSPGPPLDVMKLTDAIPLVRAVDGVRPVQLTYKLAPVGPSFTYLYHVGPGTTPPLILDAYRTWLARQGFAVVSTDHAIGHLLRRCSELGNACGSWSREFTFAFSAGRSMVLRKNTPQGPQYAAIYANQVEKPLRWSRGESRAALRDAIDFDRGDNAVMLVLVTPGGDGGGMVREEAAGIRRALSTAGRVDIYGLLFDFNRAELKPDSGPVLDQIAAVLRADPGLRMAVIGHTDDVGGAAFNLNLSRRRAQAVVEALVRDRGVDRARLIAEGRGALAPKASNATPQGRARNRRVELARR